MDGPSKQQLEALAATFRRGDFAGAEALAQQITQRYPSHGFAWNVLGGALGQLGRAAESVSALQRAAELMPHQAVVHSNLGTALKQLGRLREAEECLRLALRIRPEHADAWSNLGAVLIQQGRQSEALVYCERALQAKSDHAEALNNLGLALRELGRPEEAEGAFARALRAKPDFLAALINLGATLQNLGRCDEAQTVLRKALQVDPQSVEALVNLSVVLLDLARANESEALCRKALEIRPDSLEARENLLMSLTYSEVPAASYLEEARRYGEIVTMRAAEPFTSWRCEARPRSLRVGFVSGDLRGHSVGRFLEGVLAALDPDRLEPIAYPTNLLADDLTARIRPRFAAWRPLIGLTDRDAAKAIHSDGIHVLIDLAGHTAHNRLPVFAWKPAPVQVSWLGYFATTGVPQIDYFLADAVLLPEEQQSAFSEHVWYLPHTRLCYTTPTEGVPVNDLPAHSCGAVTFCCFNAVSKMNDGVIALWARVLLAVAGSRLFLKAKQFQSEAVRRAITERFAARGIGADRLLIEGPSPRENYFRAYQRADIALDSFPFSGATTTAEALWMGIPVLTLEGASLTSRQSASLLTNAGLADWVAADESDYVIRAAHFASDVPGLRRLRLGLRAKVTASPVFDAPLFARDFVHAVVQMWQAWAQANPAAGIEGER